MHTRTCRRCGLEKSFDDFHKLADGKPRSKCIPCYREEQREYTRDYARRKRAAERQQRLDVEKADTNALAEVMAQLKLIKERLDRLERDQIEDLLS